MSSADYNDLCALRSMPGFAKLMGIWAHWGNVILEETRRAAKKPSETNWRYAAGKQEGFEIAIQALDKAIADLEQQADNQRAQVDIDSTLREIKARGGPK